MTATLDYAQFFETEFRPQLTARRRLRRALALAILAGLFLVRPAMALAIWEER